MLPQHLRLRSPRDFETLRRQGQRWQGKRLALNAMPNDLPHSRVGFVVSGKVGKAAVRNKVKRRLRAAVREWLPAMTPGYDIVIVAYPSSAEAAYHELEVELGHLFERASLLAAAGS